MEWKQRSVISVLISEKKSQKIALEIKYLERTLGFPRK